jgi:hypothetical protein
MRAILSLVSSYLASERHGASELNIYSVLVPLYGDEDGNLLGIASNPGSLNVLVFAAACCWCSHTCEEYEIRNSMRTALSGLLLDGKRLLGDIKVEGLDGLTEASSFTMCLRQCSIKSDYGLSDVRTT